MADLGMSHLAAAELDGHFDLVTFIEEALCALEFGVKIVIVDFRTQTHFFELSQVLVLLSVTILLCLLVLELTLVKQATHGGDAVGGDLNEVEASIARDLEGLRGL